MGHLKWYKRDPRAALTGMMQLTLEERGCYNTILDLVYVHDGALEDNESIILPWLQVKARTWRRLRARLLSLGKLYIRDGCLRSERADDEVRDAQVRWLQAIKAADKRWATYREIKALADGSAMLSTSTLRSLSAKVVPIPNQRTAEKEKK